MKSKWINKTLAVALSFQFFQVQFLTAKEVDRYNYGRSSSKTIRSFGEIFSNNFSINFE